MPPSPQHLPGLPHSSRSLNSSLIQELQWPFKFYFENVKPTEKLQEYDNKHPYALNNLPPSSPLFFLKLLRSYKDYDPSASEEKGHSFHNHNGLSNSGHLTLIQSYYLVFSPYANSATYLNTVLYSNYFFPLIQDHTFQLVVVSLGDFKNTNQILLFPNFKLSAAATWAALFFLKHKYWTLLHWALQLSPQLTPLILSSPQGNLPEHNVCGELLGFSRSHFTLNFLPVT